MRTHLFFKVTEAGRLYSANHNWRRGLVLLFLNNKQKSVLFEILVSNIDFKRSVVFFFSFVLFLGNKKAFLLYREKN